MEIQARSAERMTGSDETASRRSPRLCSSRSRAQASVDNPDCAPRPGIRGAKRLAAAPDIHPSMISVHGRGAYHL